MTPSDPPAVLCFGDSLTWGYRPDWTGRHARADRWPAVLAAALGADVEVIADGLNGRTTAWDIPGPVDRNGARALPVALTVHAPLSAVAIMLGTNDLMHIEASARMAARGMKRLLEIVATTPRPTDAPAPRVLVIAPPPLCADPEGFVTPDDIARSQGLAAAYARVSAEAGARFFDAGTVARTDPRDGVHLDAANTRAIGTALAPEVRALLSALPPDPDHGV